VIGPHSKPILKISGEDNKEEIEAMLVAALEHYGEDKLDSSDLPIELLKNEPEETKELRAE
jgi:hypothetical protein